MPAIAALTLADGAATPVNHTYNPVDCTPQLAVWKETSIGVPIGRPWASLQVIEGPDSIRIKGKVVQPVLETISGDANGYVASPKVAYENTSYVDQVFSKRSTLQQRKDLRALTTAFVANAVMTAAVETNERPY